MEVPPFEPCLGCSRGDVSTFVLVEGSPDFFVAAISKLAGVGLEEAGTIARTYDQPDQTPSYYAVRLCRDCAAKAGAEALVVDQGRFGEGLEMPAYRERDMWHDE
jgi:hypothetical protein